jgi:nitrate reductase NapAB chaperone NapD
MKEIDDQIRELKENRVPKVFLTVFCDVRNQEDALIIPQKIMDSIYKMKGVESVSYTENSNVISVMALWNESEVSDKVEEIKSIPNVVNVTASILRPRF